MAGSETSGIKGPGVGAPPPPPAPEAAPPAKSAPPPNAADGTSAAAQSAQRAVTAPNNAGPKPALPDAAVAKNLVSAPEATMSEFTQTLLDISLYLDVVGLFIWLFTQERPSEWVFQKVMGAGTPDERAARRVSNDAYHWRQEANLFDLAGGIELMQYLGPNVKDEGKLREILQQAQPALADDPEVLARAAGAMGDALRSAYARFSDADLATAAKSLRTDAGKTLIRDVSNNLENPATDIEVGVVTDLANQALAEVFVLYKSDGKISPEIRSLIAKAMVEHKSDDFLGRAFNGFSMGHVANTGEWLIGALSDSPMPEKDNRALVQLWARDPAKYRNLPNVVWMIDHVKDQAVSAWLTETFLNGNPRSRPLDKDLELIDVEHLSAKIGYDANEKYEWEDRIAKALAAQKPGSAG